MDMEGPDNNDDATRRTLLKVLAAAGLTGTGIAASSGSAAAHDSDRKEKRCDDEKYHDKKHYDKKGHKKSHGEFDEEYRRYKCKLERDGEIVEECDSVDQCEVGDEVTYTGTILITDIELSDTNEVLVSGELQGTLTGDESEEVEETFDDISIGRLQEIFTVRRTDDPEDCPILEINIGGLCLELLGLQIQLETIEIDPIAIVGEDNLVSDLLCDLLRRLSRY